MAKLHPRTYIYIDGFNLYYRSLKGTPYKWLDIESMCQHLLSDNADIKAIKYFTARIKERTNSTGAVDRQHAYLAAIKAQCPLCEIIEGEYYIRKKKRKLRTPICKNNPTCFDNSIVPVIEPEEKQTDVNIASHMIEDAWLDRYDQAVLITSDTDLTTALKFVGTTHPGKREGKIVGLICPTSVRLNSKERARHIPQSLGQHATWTKTINQEAVSQSQLPDTVASNIIKPLSWHHENHKIYIASTDD